MPANTDRKYKQIIDYVVDQVGADVDRDLLRVAIASQDDPATMNMNVEEIGGTAQSGGDLIAALQSVSADDELRLRLFAEDNAGNLAEIQGEELGTPLAGTETAVVTKLADILGSVANDEARVSVYAEDDAGNLVEVQSGDLDATVAGTETGVVTVVARALAEVGNTELRTRVLGLDDAGALQEGQIEALDTGVAAGTYSQLTYLARALNSQSLDEFISRVTDSTGTQIDPLTQDATEAVGNTELRTRALGPDSAGNLRQANVEGFDTGLAATDAGVATYTARALEAIGQDHVQASLYADDPNNVLSRLNVNNNGELLTDATLSSESAFIDADDDDGNTLNPNAETLSQAIVDPDGLVTYLARALASQGQDELQVEQQTPVGIEGDDDDGNTLNVAVERFSEGITDRPGLLTYLARALASKGHDQLRVDLQNNNAGTLAVEPQTPVAVEDASGTQVNPAIQTDYLYYQTGGHDLVGSGDISIGPAAVQRATAVVIAATSTDDNAFSVSVEWVDGNGNTYQSESATDIGLDSITEDYARLVRKGPQVQVTVTDESGAAQNLVNVHADTER
jgi:hypothetical protein